VTRRDTLERVAAALAGELRWDAVRAASQIDAFLDEGAAEGIAVDMVAA
jgi:hypothetical protein